MAEAVAPEGARPAVETGKNLRLPGPGHRADASNGNARRPRKSLEPGRRPDGQGAEDLIIVAAAEDLLEQVRIGAESGAGGA
jgi:hypothetical protein